MNLLSFLILILISLSNSFAKSDPLDFHASMMNPGRFLKFDPNYLVLFSESIDHGYTLYSAFDPYRPLQLNTPYYHPNHDKGFSSNSFVNYSRIHFLDTELNPLENSLVIQTAPLPTDSPYVDVLYEKGAFGGHSFHLNFERNLIGDFGVGLGFFANSNDSGGVWQYQASVHQPYLASGRDSSGIPLNGRNLYLESSSLYPRIFYNDSIHFVEAYYFSSEVQRENVVKEKINEDLLGPQNLVVFKYPVFLENEDQSEYGIKYNYSSNRLRFSVHHYQGERISGYEGLYNRWPDYTHPDSIINYLNYRESQQSFGEKVLLGFEEFSIQFQNHFSYLKANPQLRASLLMSNTLESDEQKLSLSFEKNNFNAQLGIERNSNPLDKNTYLSHYLFSYNLPLKYFNIGATTLKKNLYPSISELLLNNLEQPHYANPFLIPTQSIENQINIDSISFLNTSLWVHHSYEVDPIINQYFVENPSTKLDERIAFRSYQGTKRNLLSMGMNMEQPLANWNFGYFYNKVLIDEILIGKEWIDNELSPKTTIGGFIKWKKALLLKQNLGLQLGLYSRWIQGFAAWAKSPYVNNEAVWVNQPNNLLVDFETRIRISTFEMYVNILNIGHQKYQFTPGYTPVGAEFRWGILWNFKG